MKTRLTPEARETLNRIVALMFEMNATGRNHAGHDQTYGALWDAVVRFLAAETGVPATLLRSLAYNWHGNRSFADDAETAIAAATEEARQAFTDADDEWTVQLQHAFRGAASEKRYTAEGRGEPGTALRVHADARELARNVWEAWTVRA